MEFNEYQRMTEETAVYPEEIPDFVSTELLYVVLGLNGEVGELTEKLKKAIREDDPSYIEEMTIEQGDVLWYWARIAEELDEDSGDIAEANLDKLLDRWERGVIEGEGDHR